MRHPLVAATTAVGIMSATVAFLLQTPVSASETAAPTNLPCFYVGGGDGPIGETVTVCPPVA